MIKKRIAHDVPPITDLNTIPSYNFKNYLMDIFFCISSPLFFLTTWSLSLYASANYYEKGQLLPL